MYAWEDLWKLKVLEFLENLFQPCSRFQSCFNMIELPFVHTSNHDSSKVLDGHGIFRSIPGLGTWLCIQDQRVGGWQWGGAGSKDGIFVPAPHGFFLPHPRSALHDGENFLPHLRPLRPREDPRSPALRRKTLFLVNFPYNYYHFFK